MAENRAPSEVEWHPRDYVDENGWEGEEIEFVAEFAQIAWRSPPLDRARLRDLVEWCRREVEKRYRRVEISRYRPGSGAWEPAGTNIGQSAPTGVVGAFSVCPTYGNV